MEAKLRDLISAARRELRRASGVPLSAEEHAEQLRGAAVDKLDLFVYRKFGFERLFALNSKCFWADKGPVVSLSSGDEKFNLQPSATDNEYILSAIVEREERELLRIDAKDPLFASRVLANIGDFLLPLPEKNNES